jgi:hypothetical protein
MIQKILSLLFVATMAMQSFGQAPLVPERYGHSAWYASDYELAKEETEYHWSGNNVEYCYDYMYGKRADLSAKVNDIASVNSDCQTALDANTTMGSIARATFQEAINNRTETVIVLNVDAQAALDTLTTWESSNDNWSTLTSAYEAAIAYSSEGNMITMDDLWLKLGPACAAYNAATATYENLLSEATSDLSTAEVTLVTIQNY